MFKTIRSKVFAMGLVIALVPMLIVLIYLESQKKPIRELAVAESHLQLNEQLQKVIDGTLINCSSQNDLLIQMVTTNINAAFKIMNEKGGIKSLPETAEWKVKNQSNNEETTINIQKLALGTVPIEKNYESQLPTIFVDDIKSLLGGTCTIFQRMNEQGDMLRIATNIINKEGKRAIGTYIPAKEPDGSSNKVIATVLKGENYVGRAQIIGEWYITAYLPIKSDDGKVYGMLYFGIKQDNLESVKKSITDIKIGKSGSAMVVGAAGAQKGVYLISKDHTLEGKSALDFKDISGKPFVAEMIEKTIANKNKVNIFEYTIAIGKETPADVTYATVYFEPWGWIILVKAFKNEFTTIADNINSAFDGLFNNFLIIAIIVVTLSLLISRYIRKNVSFNINNLIHECNELTDAITHGNLGVKGRLENVSEEFQPVIEGINNILDAYSGPIKVSMAYIKRIAKGEVPTKIAKEYKGDFEDMKNNINNLVNTMEILLNGVKSICIATLFEGKLDKRISMEGLEGRWSKLASGINDIIALFEKQVNLTSDYSTKISKGIVPEKITEEYKGDFNKFKDSMNQCIDSLGMVINEINTLTRATAAGNLKARGDEKKFEGAYKSIIGGINLTLEEVIKPLTAVVDCLHEMSKGNLNVAMDGEYKGDLKLLQDSLNTTLSQINETLSYVAQTASEVNNGSRQVANASQALSQSSTQSASSLQEVASTIQEVNSQTKQNAENAINAKTLVENASSFASKGNELMAQLTKSMGEINEASNRISKIIKVIDEIAFQTNLLALNAAVEAARAGQHGKGFTVVAEEVRNLAQRSAKAAKETSEMIENSIQKVTIGNSITKETSDNLSQIIQKVQNVTILIGEIASASKQQAASINEINTGITQLDNVTQQNTATAEETAAASQELSSHAVELQSAMEKFKLKNQNLIGSARPDNQKLLQ